MVRVPSVTGMITCFPQTHQSVFLTRVVEIKRHRLVVLLRDVVEATDQVVVDRGARVDDPLLVVPDDPVEGLAVGGRGWLLPRQATTPPRTGMLWARRKSTTAGYATPGFTLRA